MLNSCLSFHIWIQLAYIAIARQLLQGIPQGWTRLLDINNPSFSCHVSKKCVKMVIAYHRTTLECMVNKGRVSFNGGGFPNIHRSHVFRILTVAGLPSSGKSFFGTIMCHTCVIHRLYVQLHCHCLWEVWHSPNCDNNVYIWITCWSCICSLDYTIYVVNEK